MKYVVANEKAHVHIERGLFINSIIFLKEV